MCYEFSNWSWKLRAAELARKEHEAANAALRPQLVITYTPVPEPTTVLTPMALLALALGRRRAR